MAFCDKCKKEFVAAEVVKTQAQVDAENLAKRKPIGEVPGEPVPLEEPTNNVEKVKDIIAKKNKAKKKK